MRAFFPSSRESAFVQSSTLSEEGRGLFSGRAPVVRRRKCSGGEIQLVLDYRDGQKLASWFSCYFMRVVVVIQMRSIANIK